MPRRTTGPGGRQGLPTSGSDTQHPAGEAAAHGQLSGISADHFERIRTALQELGLGDAPVSGYYDVTPARLAEIHHRVLEGLRGGHITLNTEGQIESISILCHLANTQVNGCGVKLTMVYWRDPGPDPPPPAGDGRTRV